MAKRAKAAKQDELARQLRLAEAEAREAAAYADGLLKRHEEACETFNTKMAEVLILRRQLTPAPEAKQ